MDQLIGMPIENVIVCKKFKLKMHWNLTTFPQLCDFLFNFKKE